MSHAYIQYVCTYVDACIRTYYAHYASLQCNRNIEVPTVQYSMSTPSCAADTDECSSGDHLCEHFCVNTVGNYHCSCRSGYKISEDGHSCEGVCTLLVYTCFNCYDVVYLFTYTYIHVVTWAFIEYCMNEIDRHVAYIYTYSMLCTCVHIHSIYIHSIYIRTIFW